MLAAVSNIGLFQCPPLQGRWPERPEGFPTHVAIVISYGKQNGHYGCVSVRPLPPFGARPPCEAGQFWHPHGKQNGHYGRRMENRRGVTSRVEFIIAEQKWFAKNLPACWGRKSGSSGQGDSPPHGLKVSEPETPSFKARNTQFQGLKHPVSEPEILGVPMRHTGHSARRRSFILEKSGNPRFAGIAALNGEMPF